ncbi:MAG: transposon-encoded TnpW family protein [Christensenellales bacterium]|jgi:hypothetical protein
MKERDEIYGLLDDITGLLGAMDSGKRIAWFDKIRYPYPLSFGKEINGTVYAVNTHFDAGARETIREKVDRLLKQDG